MLKNNKAFTLVELIIVVAIMGLILAVGIPATRVAIDYAHKKECQSNQRLLVQTLNDYKLGVNMSFEPEGHKRWEPGTYNPETYEWETWNGRIWYPVPIYYYDEMRSAVRCADYGEYFMRQFFGGGNSTLRFPSVEEGCELYVVFVQTKEQTDKEKMANKPPAGYVEVRCTCEEHCMDEPLAVYFDQPL